ncbi:YbaB/EbfC family nucleoid-associated protein [Planctomycetales bacterium ZRK34]|nr:YbaB/EbfC family nucleoid-associated protein [Planctomycetales bacterium ZRK34]
MFDQFKNLGALMKNAGQIREKAEQLKAELERKTVEGEAGGGAVRVTMNGKMRVLRVDIDQPMMAAFASGGDDDKTMVEELIAAAVNNAVDKVQEMIAEQMREITGGMNLPGMENLLG